MLRRSRTAILLLVGVLALFGVFGLVQTVSAQKGDWGTLKGQVVWAEKALPKRVPLSVTADKEACLIKGPLFDPFTQVNAKNQGVPLAVVWLIPLNKKDSLKIHPDLLKPAKAEVSMDQPCCLFEPPVLAMRAGQTLVIKNSSGISHNANVQGGKVGPNLNPLIPPGRQVEVMKIEARPSPILVGCSIHLWMRAYIRVFDHPYFAVTDENGQFEIKNAPTGPHRLVAWHPHVGWVIAEKKNADPDQNGKPITINGGMNELGKIEMKEPKD